MKEIDKVNFDDTNRRLDTREEILYIIENEGPVLQKDLRKDFNLDSSICSRILKRLEKEGLIKRKRVTADGCATYKLFMSGDEEEDKIKELGILEEFERMDSVRGISPCFGCNEEDCDVTNCILLDLFFLRVVTEGNRELIELGVHG